MELPLDVTDAWPAHQQSMSGYRMQQQCPWHPTRRHPECLQASSRDAMALHPHAKQTDSAKLLTRSVMTWVQCRWSLEARTEGLQASAAGCPYGVSGDKYARTQKLAACWYCGPACLHSTQLAGWRCHFSSRRNGLEDLRCD